MVRAKTGSLDSVSSLAGYAGSNRMPLVFAILVSNFAKRERKAVRAAQDEIAEIIVAYSIAAATNHAP